VLVPRPPRPVAPRRAVPMVTVAFKQAQAIAPGHVLQLTPEAVEAVEAGALVARGQGAPAEPPICFAVSYRLTEYLAILREHVPRGLLAWEQARGKVADGRLSWSTRAALKLMVPLVGAMVFARKKRLMPVCRFTVDEQGLVRDTAAGRLVIAWNDVRAVHRLSGAWLVDKGAGAVPIPYRCLSADQHAAFERLLLSRFPHATPV